MKNVARLLVLITAGLLLPLAVVGCAATAESVEARRQCEASGRIVYYQQGWGHRCVTTQEASVLQAEDAARRAGKEREKDRQNNLHAQCIAAGGLWNGTSCWQQAQASGQSSSRSGSAPERWDRASLDRQGSTGDMTITRCFYRTMGGYAFSTDVRGFCPANVEVNVESGRVR
jgi:hypothetical protein